MALADALKQLAQLSPGIIAGLKGDGNAMKAFMDSYQQTSAQLDEEERRKQTMGMQAEDRQRMITRQTEQDTIAGEERDYRKYQDALQLLGQVVPQSETLEGAEAMSQGVLSSVPPNVRERVAGMADAQLRQMPSVFSRRRVDEFKGWVKGLDKAKFLAQIRAEGADADITPHLQAKAPRMLEIMQQQRPGKTAFSISDVYDVAGMLEPAEPEPRPSDTVSMQPKEVLVGGKLVLANFNPKTGTYTDQSGNPVMADAVPSKPVGGGDSTNDARTNARIDRITGAFNSSPIVKEFNEVLAQSQTIAQIANGAWSGPGDMSIVFAFMKALDPSSVVRETEYANAAQSGNIFSGWAAKFNGALSPSGGFLSPQVKADFLKTIEARMGVKKAQYDNLRKQTVQKIDRIKAGAPETGDEAVIDYGAAFPAAAGGGGYKVGQKVRNKKTGALGEVTGVQPDGKPIIKPVSQ